MKRLVALWLCIAMILIAMPTFAETSFALDPITIRYSEANAEQSLPVTVTGRYGKAVVLRVFDRNNQLLYIDSATPVKGSFSFDSFTLDKPNLDGIEGTEQTAGSVKTTTYALTYTFVISDATSILNSDTTAVDFQYQTREKIGSTGVSAGESTTKKETSSAQWSDDSNKSETGWDDSELPSYIDRLDNEGKNKALWEAVNSAVTAMGAANTITAITQNTKPELMLGETARNNVAVAAEVMTSNISAKKIRVSKSNTLKLGATSISAADLSKLDKTVSAIEQAIRDNKIELNREMSKELTLNVSFNNKTSANITISKELVSKLDNVDVLTIKDTDFQISYTVDELKEMLGDQDEISYAIDKSGLNGETQKIAVNFNTDKTQLVKISFPGLTGNTRYMAIVDEQGNPVGGRYNPSTGVMEAKINESGIYQLVNNEKNFDDIKDKSEEIQESIKILAAKGIIQGTSETEFSPDDTITRAEIVALLLRVLSQIDPNADGGFDDVKQSDWFFGTAGSSKQYGLVVGFEDNTFRGNSVILKDQILTIASRVLQKEMKYMMPDDPQAWLAFTDAAAIPDWAKSDIALATMANVITRTEDNRISSAEPMTRGDAALIIMRLFYKIW